MIYPFEKKKKYSIQLNINFVKHSNLETTYINPQKVYNEISLAI